MDELRILLLGIGLVVLALIYLWGMRKQIRERIAERRRRAQARVPENEPQLASSESRDESDVDVWSEPEIRVIRPATTASTGRSPGIESDRDSTDPDSPAFEPVTPAESKPSAVEPKAAVSAEISEPASTGSDTVRRDVGESAASPTAPTRPEASRSAESRPATDRSRIESRSSGRAGTSYVPSSDAREGRRRSADEMTVLLTVMAPPGQQLRGGAIRVACEASDLVLGEGVWECRTEAAEEPAMIFGIAHLREPGTFAADSLNALETPGLLLFMRLPGPLDPVPAVDLMIAVAGRLARRLGAAVCDQKRNRMSTQAMIRLRADAAEFERRIQTSIGG